MSAMGQQSKSETHSGSTRTEHLGRSALRHSWLCCVGVLGALVAVSGCGGVRKTQSAPHSRAQGHGRALILFAGARGLSTLSLNDRVVRVLIPSKDDQQGAWSPDGRRIAFSGDGGVLEVMNADGSGRHRLTTVAKAANPAWSPSGRLIAFASNGQGRTKALYVVAPDGSGLRKVALLASVVGAPVWAPDDSHFLIVAFHGSRQGIYLVAADGSGERRLVTEDGIGGSPAWSPDGSQIAFERIMGGGCRCLSNSDIVVMSADARRRRRVAHVAFGPSWSPTGKLISFAHPAAPSVARCWGGAIEAVRPDGTRRRRLTSYTDDPSSPVWSPDGRRFAFSSDGRCQPHPGDPLPDQLFISQANGTGLMQVTKPPTAVEAGTLAWRPVP